MLITLSDGQVITITNWNSATTSRLEQFEFADGTVWESTDIISNLPVEANKSSTSNQHSIDNQGEFFSKISSIDANLNLLIQSYSSFGDASDESELVKERYSIILPVIESFV